MGCRGTTRDTINQFMIDMHVSWHTRNTDCFPLFPVCSSVLVFIRWRIKTATRRQAIVSVCRTRDSALSRRAAEGHPRSSRLVPIALALTLAATACARPATAQPTPAPSECPGSETAELVWPQLTELRPTQIAPGGAVKVIASGGFLRCGRADMSNPQGSFNYTWMTIRPAH